jgi:putative ABC transport system permease protein
MDFRPSIRARLRDLAIEPAVQASVIEELAAHLEDSYSAALASGLDEPEARARALEELGDPARLAGEVARIQPAVRKPVPLPLGGPPPDGSRASLGRDAWRDVRYAVRLLARAPGFASVALATLALGLGANVAIFSLVDGILLRPLRYPAAGQLVVIHATDTRHGEGTEIAYLDYLDIRAGANALSRLAAGLFYAGTLTGADGAVRVQGYEVTPGFFDVLGVRPLLGRTFRPEEGKPGRDAVAILGYGFWQRRFGGDASVVGRSLTLNGVPVEVVGVLPAGFRQEWPTFGDDLYAPTTAENRLARSRAIYTYFVIGRLGPGETLGQLRTQLRAVGARLAAAHPDTNATRSFTAVTLHDQAVGRMQRPLWLLLGAVGLVLLAACANLASLLLARATVRRRELAMRLALGASRSRLLRLALTESTLLAFAGGMAGVALAAFVVSALRALPGSDLPLLANVHLDGRVMGFALLLSFITGFAFGLAPAALLPTQDLNDVLRGGGRHIGSPSQSRLRRFLVVGQMALALMLLVGVGLLAASFDAVLRVNPGFDTSHLLTVRITAPDGRVNSREDAAAFFGGVVHAAAGLPGVRAAGITSSLPLSGQHVGTALSIQGSPRATADLPSLGWQFVRPGYFGAMGIPLLAGRDFTESDLARARHVTIISESAARRFFNGRSPIGQRVYYGVPNENDQDWHEIIGIVGDTRHLGLEDEPEPAAYDLLGQHWGRTLTLVLRTSGDPADMAPALRARLRELDRGAVQFAMATGNDLWVRALAPRRFGLAAAGAFALLAFALALVGIYGVVSYTVSQRVREFGVRMALGARSGDIARQVVGQGLRLTLAGVFLGLVGALVLSRFLATLLFGVTITDPTVYGLATAVLVAVALAACAAPARRATRVDPLEALRGE